MIHAMKLSGVEGTSRKTERQQTKNKSTDMKNLTSILAAALALSLAGVQAADVKELYEKNCTKCHGADGKADTKMGKKTGTKDLTDPKVQAAFTDAQAFKTIKEGKKDNEDKVQMKPLEGASDEDIKALVAYSRSFKK